MKEIIINENNKAKIETALNEVQKRARARTIDVDDIVRTCEHMEKKFSFICKKDIEGMSFSIDIHGQVFPVAYQNIACKCSPQSTYFSCKIHNGKWRLTNVWRNTTARNYLPKIVIPDAMKEAIIRAYENGKA